MTGWRRRMRRRMRRKLGRPPWRRSGEEGGEVGGRGGVDAPEERGMSEGEEGGDQLAKEHGGKIEPLVEYEEKNAGKIGFKR